MYPILFFYCCCSSGAVGNNQQSHRVAQQHTGEITTDSTLNTFYEAPGDAEDTMKVDCAPLQVHVPVASFGGPYTVYAGVCVEGNSYYQRARYFVKTALLVLRRMIRHKDRKIWSVICTRVHHFTV